MSACFLSLPRPVSPKAVLYPPSLLPRLWIHSLLSIFPVSGLWDLPVSLILIINKYTLHSAFSMAFLKYTDPIIPLLKIVNRSLNFEESPGFRALLVDLPFAVPHSMDSCGVPTIPGPPPQPPLQSGHVFAYA